MADFEQLTLERDGAVAVVTFANLPDGQMTVRTVEELGRALDVIEADDGIRAVVLQGAGNGIFIRHFSLPALYATGEKLRAKGASFSAERIVPESPFHVVMRRVESSPKPFVAALNGTAMGGGFELALACDLRITEFGDYRFGLPEVNIGLLPGGGGTQRLTRAIGVARALELCLLGRTVSPPDAASYGMVHELAENAVAIARARAQELAGKSPKAVAHIKMLVRGALDRPLDQGLGLERTLICDLMVSDEAQPVLREGAEGTRRIEDRGGAR